MDGVRTYDVYINGFWHYKKGIDDKYAERRNAWMSDGCMVRMLQAQVLYIEYRLILSWKTGDDICSKSCKTSRVRKNYFVLKRYGCSNAHGLIQHDKNTQKKQNINANGWFVIPLILLMFCRNVCDVKVEKMAYCSVIWTHMKLARRHMRMRYIQL